MPRNAREVGAALEKKGFVTREGDHTFYHLIVGGKKTVISTKLSHGEKEIGDKLLAMMGHQLCLSRRDFLDLVDCPLSHDDCLKLLRDAGKIAKPAS